MVQLSSLAGWDIAKLAGCHYTGDCNPIDHGGYFIDCRDWEKYGYADTVEVFRNNENDSIVVQCGTINRNDDMSKAFSCCGWKCEDGRIVNEYDGETVGDDSTILEIEACLAYNGSEPAEDFSGQFVQSFDDDTDEDEIWEDVKGWIFNLGK